MAKERGYTFCKNGKPTKGIETTGTSHSVSFPISCPTGSKPRAIFHIHPSGSLRPSAQDMKESRRLNLPVCIKAGGRVRCYRSKR